MAQLQVVVVVTGDAETVAVPVEVPESTVVVVVTEVFVVVLVTEVGVEVVVGVVIGDVETVIEPFTVCVTVPFDAYTVNEYVPPASLVGVPDNSHIVPLLFENKIPGGILSTPRAVVCPIISYETVSIGVPIKAD